MRRPGGFRTQREINPLGMDRTKQFIAALYYCVGSIRRVVVAVDRTRVVVGIVVERD